MNYLWHVLIMVSLYAVLAASLNLLVGYGGIVSLCHAAFYALGAYATALLMMNAGWEFLPALLGAVFLTAALSLVISLASIRLNGDRLVLATLAFQMIVYNVIYNWADVTQGSYGIVGIPVPRVFGIEINTAFRYFLLAGTFTVLCAAILYTLASSPFGRALKAKRDDEMAAQSLGKNVALLRVHAFAFAAAFAAVAGGLFAGYARYIDPSSFTLNEAILVLSMVVIGGAGNPLGPLVGAFILVTMPEALRFLNISDAAEAHLRQMIYGFLLVIVMRFRPTGLKGEYGFD